MADVALLARRRVRPDQTAVTITNWSAGVQRGSSTYNFTTHTSTRDEIGSQYSVNSVWPHVAHHLKYHRSELSPNTRRIYEQWDWGNPYRCDSLKLTQCSFADVNVTRVPRSTGSGAAGTSQIFPAISSLKNLWPSALTATLLTLDQQEQLLLARGAHAVASTLPQQPHADLIPALTELMKGELPTLVHALPARLTPNEVASSYLNWMFGLRPALQDIRGTLEVVKRSRQLLSEYARRYEKRYRRQFQYEPQVTAYAATSSGIAETASLFPWGASTNWASKTTQLSGKATTTCRFSGEYIYHQFVSGQLETRLQQWAAQADRLLGLDPTRLVHVWDSVPWTWLVDWFVNVGDVLRNASYIGRDGLVLRYGYLTVHQEITMNYSGPRLTDWADYTAPLSWAIRQKRKTRIKATPYGFGLDPVQFSSKHWAILSALGITRFGPHL